MCSSKSLLHCAILPHSSRIVSNEVFGNVHRRHFRIVRWRVAGPARDILNFVAFTQKMYYVICCICSQHVSKLSCICSSPAVVKVFRSFLTSSFGMYMFCCSAIFADSANVALSSDMIFRIPSSSIVLVIKRYLDYLKLSYFTGHGLAVRFNC